MLHYFSGPYGFGLSEAIELVADQVGLCVEVVSRDWLRGGEDLGADEPYTTDLAEVAEGGYHIFHAGFPCSSFSRVRFAPGGPPPVRDRQNLLGLPSNNGQRQAEAERGTLYARRAAALATAMLQGEGTATGTIVATLENPPDPGGTRLPSAWLLEEIQAWLNLPEVRVARFDSCTFGTLVKKPQQFAGSLEALSSERFNRHCVCLGPHPEVRGKTATAEAAAYPRELCLVYARAALAQVTARVIDGSVHGSENSLKAGKRNRGHQAEEPGDVSARDGPDELSTGDGEPRRELAEDVTDKARFAPRAQLTSASEVRARQSTRNPSEGGVTVPRAQLTSASEIRAQRSAKKSCRDSGATSVAPVVGAKVWEVRGYWGNQLVRVPEDPKPDAPQFDELPGTVPSQAVLPGAKAAARELEDSLWLGGMRNPRTVLRRVPGWARVGQRIRRVIETTCKRLGKGGDVAERLGDATYAGPETGVLEAIREDLCTEFGATRKKQAPLPWGANMDLEIGLLEQIARQAGDPEKEVMEWMEHGCPLGIDRQIARSGVFPPAETGEGPPDEEQAPWRLSAFENYGSVLSQPERAKKEFDRMLTRGFAVPISEGERAELGGSHYNKMGLIVKERPDGTEKLRLIIDMRESGANAQATVPERGLLPRARDAVQDACEVWRSTSAAVDGDGTREDWGVEWFAADFRDAYAHLPVHPEELRHTVVKLPAPCREAAKDSKAWAILPRLCFGAKAAPLVWSRVAALLARVAQGILAQGTSRLQLYLDDPIFATAARCCRSLRDVTCVLLCWACLGFQMSWNKCSRGSQVTWIGVRMAAVAEQRFVVCTIPAKAVEELLAELEEILRAGYVPVRRLRRLAG
ncbi:MAG: hypothetical protein GY772_00830, partial [bacterium]|nr:hypothetical protein [bacterium]